MNSSKSGSPGDPERQTVYEQLQLVCGGHKTGAVLAAQIDSLAATIAFAARDRAQAEQITLDVLKDIRSAIDGNWEYVRTVRATSAGASRA